MPQVLADAGIKYFTNGSDPIRGALNPIGLLNFKSPFYWEAPNGSRVLVWSGVSYTAIDDMTWGGWNAEAAASGRYAPSILGLTRSLPLFLSQDERADFPFDAVQLFGLHNDEIPHAALGRRRRPGSLEPRVRVSEGDRRAAARLLPVHHRALRRSHPDAQR